MERQVARSGDTSRPIGGRTRTRGSRTGSGSTGSADFPRNLRSIPERLRGEIVRRPCLVARAARRLARRGEQEAAPDGSGEGGLRRSGGGPCRGRAAPAPRAAALDRAALERVGRRRRGRAPAGDGDLRAPARLARPGDRARLAQGGGHPHFCHSDGGSIRASITSSHAFSGNGSPFAVPSPAQPPHSSRLAPQTSFTSTLGRRSDVNQSDATEMTSALAASKIDAHSRAEVPPQFVHSTTTASLSDTPDGTPATAADRRVAPRHERATARSRRRRATAGARARARSPRRRTGLDRGRGDGRANADHARRSRRRLRRTSAAARTGVDEEYRLAAGRGERRQCARRHPRGTGRPSRIALPTPSFVGDTGVSR